MPAQGETRTANGETRQWDGSGWVLLGGSSMPKGTSEPWNEKDTQASSNAFKTFMGLGGSVAGSLLGPAGTIAGGAIGRAVGHIPEALITSATGKPNDGSFANDAAEGAMEGGASEMAPAVGGPLLKFGGKAFRVTGDALSKVGGDLAPYGRAALSHLFGGNVAMDLAAAAAPPAMSGGGRMMERGGEAIGGRRLSELTAPMKSLFGVEDAPLELSEATRAAAGTRRSSEVPYRAGSGVSDRFVDETRDIGPHDVWQARNVTPDEPVFSDVRGDLDKAATLDDELNLVRESVAKGMDRGTAKRIILDKPSMRSVAPKISVQPSEALASLLGSPSDAEMQAALAARKRTGQWNR